MAVIAAINFRGSSGYVTDASDETYSLGEAYPTTRSPSGGGSYTFGWNGDNSANTRDRDSSNDRRLAGINFTNAAGKHFQIDLPAAGTYKVYVAAGDVNSGNGALWDLCDTTTVLASLTKDGLNANEFVDATDTILTHSTWPGSNTPLTLTFATTAFRLKLSAPATSNNVIAHLRIESVETRTPRRKPRILHEPTPEYPW